MELTSANVEQLTTTCLFHEGEQTTPAILAEAIMATYAFHPGRIEEHQEEIHQLLLQLPEPFQLSKGGGWSFLNMCMRADDVQWTGLHLVQEMLLALGLAAGWMSMTPRSLWPAFHGGMPYVTVMDARSPMPLTTELPDVLTTDAKGRPQARCIGCGKTPDELEEYVAAASEEVSLTPDDFVWGEEGTLNRDNGHFACTACYIKMGQPSSPGGWVAS